MNVSNLKEGMVIKNYKELCSLLETEVKTSNSKKSQMKDLERYLKYHKQGHTFHIDEIYKLPLPPNNNITQYIPIIEKLIMHVIVTQSKKNVLYINKSKLHETLKMINNEYTAMKYNKLKLSENKNIPKEVIDDFYNSSDDLLERNVTQALKSLKNQALIKSNEVYSVCQYVTRKDTSEIGKLSKLKYEHRKATNKEVSLILKLQRDALHKLECKDISEVYHKGKSYEFHKMIKDYLFTNHNIKYYYTSYELIFNKKHIDKAYSDSKLYELDEESYYISSNLLNENISNKITNMALDRIDHASKLSELTKHQLQRLDDNYLNDIKSLINELVISN